MCQKQYIESSNSENIRHKKFFISESIFNLRLHRNQMSFKQSFSKARQKEDIEEEHMPNNFAFIYCNKVKYKLKSLI